MQNEDIGKAVVDRTMWDPNQEHKLEAFPNKNLSNDYLISFCIPEYTSLCPWSGFPDFATIKIRYVPGPKCVELKALKLYVNAFRNTKISHETVPNRIMNDFIEICQPKYIEVTGDFGIRGNIKTIVRVAKQIEKISQEVMGQMNDPSFRYESA